MEIRLGVGTLAAFLIGVAAGLWFAFAVALGANAPDDATNPIWLAGWIATIAGALTLVTLVVAKRRAARSSTGAT